MIIDGDDLIFSTGKRVYANNGIVGISPEGQISEGYDGLIDDDKLTPSEKSELAGYVIKMWTKYSQ